MRIAQIWGKTSVLISDVLSSEINKSFSSVNCSKGAVPLTARLRPLKAELVFSVTSTALLCSPNWRCSTRKTPLAQADEHIGLSAKLTLKVISISFARHLLQEQRSRSIFKFLGISLTLKLRPLKIGNFKGKC